MALWTDLEGLSIAGRYELRAHLATGGMAAVFRGWDLRLRRPVAVKLLRHDAADLPETELVRFRREARAIAALRSPHIVEVYDFVEDGGRTYLMMELVDGPNLKQRILDAGPLAAEEALTCAIHVCRALAQAHAHHFIHRDIKPQNILLDFSGTAKLTDFGIVHVGGGPSLTASGLVLGTADYIAPEQAQGLTLEPASDLYSLGVVLFEMLTGAVPFNGQSATAVALRHTTEPLPPLRLRNPDVPPLIERIVLRACAKNPAQRFTSAAQMEAALAHALAVCGSPAATVLAGAGRSWQRGSARGGDGTPGTPARDEGDTDRSTRALETADPLDVSGAEEPDDLDWHDVALLLSASPLTASGDEPAMPFDETQVLGPLPPPPADPAARQHPRHADSPALDTSHPTLPRGAVARLALTLGTALLLLVAILTLRMLL